MIILDTNILSELMRPEPAELVSQWISQQSAPSLFVTTITQAEIFYGLALLPSGQRRTLLKETVEQMFAEDFNQRVLSFDTAAARTYAVIAAGRRTAGRPISQSDAQIAAIALTYGATVATRNVSDFEGCGLTVLNPWNIRIS
jgi:predicted nucleic acid-binding protein